MNKKLSWLHLSDLHIQAEEQSNQEAFFASLLGDIAGIVGNEGLLFDIVLVTGDVAMTGHVDEYKFAARFLRDLGMVVSVPMDRIFCVPGNHDVDRTALTPHQIRSAKSALNTRDIVSEVIGDPDELAFFTKRLLPYHAFIQAQFPWARNIGSSDLGYTQRMEVNGLNLAILGLNSSWLSGSPDDYGHLVIGERQVREALERASGADLVVSLVHHPTSWLADFDASDVRELLTKRCDFMLHGHVHETGVVNIVSPDSEAFSLAAGAKSAGSRGSCSYNYVQIDLHQGTVDISIRRYFDRDGEFWAPDKTMYEGAPEGKLTLMLPERITRKVQTADLIALNHRLSAVVSETMPFSAPTEPVPPVPMAPTALVEAIVNHRCLLFAGAGASMDAKLPGWPELLHGMADRCEYAGILSEEEKAEIKSLLDARSYMVVAAFCREKLGKFDFATYLREQLTDSRASKTHRLLARIPFRGAATTNFDSFIEHHRDRPQVVMPSLMDRLGAAGVETLLADRSAFPVIKIHGSILDTESIVLTRGDFRQALFSMPGYRDFLRRLFLDSTVFFYGYSFSDPNVDFLLQDIVTSYAGNTRPHYALLPSPGKIASKYWFEDFNIRVIPYPLWEGSHAVATAFLEKLTTECDARVGSTPRPA
ncbi:SIR2 family protein [Paraburkholderia sp. MM5477-R1]|uniref:SIR2 family protein n=1 Tax=Paraburkholderia sp. MM5477-R1 TaxID=2991062 RepID=UPI003D1DDAA2